MQTVVGLYRTVSEANSVKQALVNEGYSGGDITVIDQSESSYGRESGYEGTDTSVGAKIKHFFQGLTGHEEHEHTAFTQGVSQGGALVAVNVSDGETDRAAAVLQQYGASEIEGGNNSGTGYSSTTGTGAGAYAGTTGTTGSTGSYGTTGTGLTGTNNTTGTGLTGNSTVTGEQVIPVVEEELLVGKRQVERGGVRVYSRVVSEPVSESVSLHEERVLVDRRTVDRPATDADFRDAGPIEVRATGEEAVVGKTGRVVEEVVVGKTATDRTETVEDSVRHTEVDVEPVATGVGTTGTAGSTRTTDKF